MIISSSKNCITNLLCLFYFNPCPFFSKKQKLIVIIGEYVKIFTYTERFDHFNRRKIEIQAI